MHPILTQTIYYGVVLLLSITIISFLQKGFFWKYVRVKLSFGKFILVKVRAVNRDYYRVGHIQESFLIYKGHKNDKRLVIQDKGVFYRCMGVSWVDVDDQKNALMKADYEPVSGFDAVKYNDLYLRALMKPTIADTKEKLIIASIIIIGLICIGTLFFVYTMSKDISIIKAVVQGLSVGTVSPGSL